MIELAIVVPALIIFMTAGLELMNVLRVWNTLSGISKDVGREIYQTCVKEPVVGVSHQSCLDTLMTPGSPMLNALYANKLQGARRAEIVGSIYVTSPGNEVSLDAQQNSLGDPNANTSRVSADLLEEKYMQGGDLGRVPNQGFAVSEVFYTYQPLFGVSFPFVDAFIRDRNGVVYEVTIY